MSELPRIDSRESLEAWLETRPRENGVAVAHRAALRVLPLWLSEMKADWAQEVNLTGMPLLRLCLIFQGFLHDRPASDIVDITVPYATAFARRAEIMEKTPAAFAARSAFSSGFSSRIPTISSDPVDVFDDAPLIYAIRDANSRHESLKGDFGSIHVAFAVSFAHDAIELISKSWDMSDFEKDIGDITAGRNLFDIPLWRGGNPLADAWAASHPILHDTPGGDFWIDWYQRALDGRPQNWPLLRDVALIDHALWNQGGEALDREINRTVERHRLLEEVRRLKAELAEASSVTAAAVVAHRGHNQPPELLPDYVSEMSASARTIAEQLDEAEEELQQSQPSPSRLRRIGQGLNHAVMTVLRYCGELADVALKEAAKKAGAAAGVAFVGYVVLNQDKLLEFAKALIRLADKF